MHLNNNKLKKIDKNLLIDISNKNKTLREFFLFNNLLDEKSIHEIERKLDISKFKLKSLYSTTQPGYLKYISKLSNDLVIEYPQLNSFEWPNTIPIFSVITGKNGIGKTSVLKMIQNILNL